MAGAASRRRFVQGLTLAGLASGLWTPQAQAQIRSQAGSPIALTIGDLAVNLTGRPRRATVVNGSLPGPILRLCEGDDAIIAVTNTLTEFSSIHWHGLRLPSDQDGVPGLSYRGVAPGETFTYRFPVRQAGTYWYHSHSGMQEQTGLIGALILEPRGGERVQADREHVILLSDWTDADPMSIVANLKQQSDYYDYHRRTLGDLIRDAHDHGAKPALDEAAMWARMRMSPTDIQDVSGAVYTYLVNGSPPAANWTGLFHPGERVRLRVINGSAMTTFDVRIPGLTLTVIAADGSDIEPVEVEEFRIGVAETYDLIVQPREDRAYTLFAQAEDRTGYARATLSPRLGLAGPIPPMDPRPVRSMSDMGMGGMAKGGEMAGMDMSDPTMAGMKMDTPPAGPKPSGVNVDNVAVASSSRLGEAGDGLEGDDRRALTYADLKAAIPQQDLIPSRTIEFHLTGNMERWIWGFDGRTFSEAEPVRIALGETVRFILINDTMMEHPIHLHGFLFQLENGQDGRRPLKHTLNVKPAERASLVFTADTAGHWAFHCHLMYHMETGMFRTVLVA
ncbi:MAG TPA: copper resistance system multicopper oxidase [Caulobacteraceae bacterium]